jgi:hypothetical protein
LVAVVNEIATVTVPAVVNEGGVLEEMFADSLMVVVVVAV